MHIGELEELVLLAVQQLGEDAYGVPVRTAMEEAGRSVSVGTLYITLDRLENKGLIKGRQGEVTPERGGKAKRYFRLTGEGNIALRKAEETRARLLLLPPLVGGAS